MVSQQETPLPCPMAARCQESRSTSSQCSALPSSTVGLARLCHQDSVREFARSGAALLCTVGPRPPPRQALRSRLALEVSRQCAHARAPPKRLTSCGGTCEVPPSPFKLAANAPMHWTETERRCRVFAATRRGTPTDVRILCELARLERFELLTIGLPSRPPPPGRPSPVAVPRVGRCSLSNLPLESG